MAELEMMDDAKDMTHESMIDHVGEEEVVEEDYLDNENVMMSHDMTIGYAEEHEVLCEDDDAAAYGGMDHDIYEAIVEFKTSGSYPGPHLIDQSRDRSAHCHWRLRCSRFALGDDGLTLMYSGGDVPKDDQPPKFVIKKGEVKDVIGRVHEIIGHVGTKRTQAALQKKLYWRSVRNDVMQYVANCDFCRKKKEEGKKLSKAPFDIQSENFDLIIDVQYTSIRGRRNIEIHLIPKNQDGYDETYIHRAMTRMTTYTFRSTDSEHRKMFRTPPYLKRQPYLRRPRYDHSSTPSSYYVPMVRGETKEPAYISLASSRLGVDHHLERMAGEKHKYSIDEDIEEEELQPVDPSVASGSSSRTTTTSGAGPSTSRQHPGQPRFVGRHRGLRPAKIYDPNHPAYRRSRVERELRNAQQRQGMRGAASRLSGLMAQRSDGQPSASTSALAERHIMYGQGQGLVGHELVTPYEEARERPESTLLSPVLLIPSNDPEVAELQKELLTRQLEIQKMQMRIMQAHLDGTHHHGRYEEEVVVDGREDGDELNVIDSDDRY